MRTASVIACYHEEKSVIWIQLQLHNVIVFKKFMHHLCFQTKKSFSEMFSSGYRLGVIGFSEYHWHRFATESILIFPSDRKQNIAKTRVPGIVRPDTGVARGNWEQTAANITDPTPPRASPVDRLPLTVNDILGESYDDNIKRELGPGNANRPPRPWHVPYTLLLDLSSANRGSRLTTCARLCARWWLSFYTRFRCIR